MHQDIPLNMEVTDGDPNDSTFKDPKASRKQGRGRPPKYTTADMSLASMAAILTTMAGEGVKPQVVRITEEDVAQLEEEKDTAEESQQQRPYQCELCDKRFKEV